jgi:hypothetical protein
MFSISVVRKPTFRFPLENARVGIHWNIGFRSRLGSSDRLWRSRQSWTRLNAHLLRDIGESPHSAQIAQLREPLNTPLGLVGADRQRWSL